MRMYDIIKKKRDGGEISAKEIEAVINGYTDGEIPDYQVSALLMAVYFNGMTAMETVSLTSAMAHSGDMLDFSELGCIMADKHSTGGVGDKTTLIIAPTVSACGVCVAKISGRGLGHTGGTVDKLEAIPGFRTSLSYDEFLHNIKDIGICLSGQFGNTTPADKKLYALRDVTATVDSIPLIAASIMSKKLAGGSKNLLLDVKTGSGAFMKNLDDAKKLARAMVDIGKNSGVNTAALITDMDKPLGRAAGNAIEVIEAVETLKGRGPEDLTELCKALSANMLYLSGKGDIDECEKMVADAISSGRALEKFKALVAAQGGDVWYISDTERFEKAAFSEELIAPRDGYVTAMDTERCGIACMKLGAGRSKKDDIIDMLAGIRFIKKTGEPVKSGETAAVLYSSDESKISDALAELSAAYIFGETKPESVNLIQGKIC